MIDRKVHLEPFIRIPIQYATYQRKIRTCGEHENFKGDSYCPKCGKEIKIQIVPDKQQLWCEELIGNENFYQYFEDETMYLFSNIHDVQIDNDENKFTVITVELIDSLINKFESLHKEDIQKLSEKLNSKLKVEFGFVYAVS